MGGPPNNPADLANFMGALAGRYCGSSVKAIEVCDPAARLLVAREDGIGKRTPFEDYRLNGAELSGKALAVLRRRLAGEQVEQGESGLSAREWRELEALLAGG